MKNKIKQFSKGDFKLSKPDIVFPETNICISVGEGEMYQGSFTIENRKDGDIRGLVYPSSFRVHCLEQGFDGNPVKIHYTYDSTGLKPGYVENSKITVVCNGGEYDIAFTAMIEKPYIMTEYGKIQTMSDFKHLAIKDFSEARRLFRSRHFYDVLKYEERRVKNLYDNMRKWSLDELALEEFLVGIKQKEKIYLTLSKGKMEYSNLSEDKKDSVEITKNTWGYVPIQVRTDGDFIKITNSECSTEDFVGNTMQLDYYIEKEKLHAGYNYGRIYVKTPYETLSMDVNVHQRVLRQDTNMMSGMIAGQGLKEYLAFLAGKMDVDTWVEKAIRSTNELLQLEPENEYYSLLQAHIYLRVRREDEAKWILENGNFSRFAIGRKVEVSAYYQFLTALLKKDSVTVSRVLEELNRLYIKHPYSWQLLCMIINLDPKYRNYSDRLRVLERQFFNGSNQVLLYAEAYVCFQEKVVLLHKLDSFEIQILNFAAKYKILTKELAVYAAELIAQQKKYNKKLVKILERAYAMYEDSRILNALCMQLIKGNKIGHEYFRWYEKAVQQELKIAQLYEYYMTSMDEKYVKSAFPRMVYLYFLHGVNLDYKKTALLYANILTYEKESGDIFQSYKNQMRDFAWGELRKRHINDSLRILYNRFIQEGELTTEDREALYDICHKYHVTTTQKDVKYVLVIERDGSVRQRVAYSEQGTYVYLFDKEARIVWEAKDGFHYIDSISYDVVRMFYEMRFMELCKKQVENRLETERKKEQVPLSFDTLKMYGIDTFDEQDIFLLCTKRIREHENVEDDFLLYICFELFKRGCYDKALLKYLAHFYCGATKDMKKLWNVSREYGVEAKGLAERIITQMLFSEVMFQEDDVFEDYYTGKPYFRLKQAYLAYASYKYVLENRDIKESIFAIMIREFAEKSYLADICKAAVLKYFSDKAVDDKTSSILQGYLRELCEKKMIFAFYQNYPKQWLKEMQLYDKKIVEYHSEADGKVKIFYRLNRGEWQAETLLATYENTYVKEFILYSEEMLEYYFQEEYNGTLLMTEKEAYVEEAVSIYEGKYGRLNQIIQAPKEEQMEFMLQYRREEELAEEMFPIY